MKLSEVIKKKFPNFDIKILPGTKQNAFYRILLYDKVITIRGDLKAENIPKEKLDAIIHITKYANEDVIELTNHYNPNDGILIISDRTNFVPYTINVKNIPEICKKYKYNTLPLNVLDYRIAEILDKIKINKKQHDILQNAESRLNLVIRGNLRLTILTNQNYLNNNLTIPEIKLSKSLKVAANYVTISIISNNQDTIIRFNMIQHILANILDTVIYSDNLTIDDSLKFVKEKLIPLANIWKINTNMPAVMSFEKANSIITGIIIKENL